jgi:hypothetical protein
MSDYAQIREQYEVFNGTGVLSNNLMLEAGMADFYWNEATDKSRWRTPPISQAETAKIQSKVDMLTELCKQFEDKVWYGRDLMPYIKKSTESGHSGENQRQQVLLFASAGRVMLTFRDKKTNESITLITADGEKRGARVEMGGCPDEGPMGVQSVDGNPDNLAELLKDAITNMPSLCADDEISMGSV